MEKYYGFDLGDAESAVARLDKKQNDEVKVLTIRDARSFVTAYALLKDGQLVIGEGACYVPDALMRRIRFKSRFLDDPHAAKDIRSFAAGVLGELYLNADLVKGEDVCFYIGCPAGWDKSAREEYREIFEKCGYPPVKIISESRAALVSACQSRHLQVGHDILSRPVLVVDIGSSTTDFAYINGGREVELRTGGEVRLGGGIMDELLLEEAVNASSDSKKIRKIFSESEAWKNYCEFACRRLKEKYFSDEEYWQDNDCTQSVTIRYSHFPVHLKLRLNREIAEKLLKTPGAHLNNRSFEETFKDSMPEAKAGITDKEPELIFMTGGVSKMKEIRKWCQEAFPDAVVISGSEPEFAVAKGLAECGRIDEELKEFRKDVEDLIESTTVEQIVEDRSPDLYRSAVDAVVEPILKQAVLPVIEEWRQGKIERLKDIDPLLQKEIRRWLQSEEGREVLKKPVAAWLKKTAYALEEHTVPICLKHHVPYSALSLNSYFGLSDVDISFDTKNLFAVDELTWMIDTVVSLVVGLLCGGSGIALIANGLPGIAAGVVISLLVLVLGRKQMQKVMVNMKIPSGVRKMLPKSYFENRLERMSLEIKLGMYDQLENVKNEEISGKLVREISDEIETCLTRMAEVVEIPLGESVLRD